MKIYPRSQIGDFTLSSSLLPFKFSLDGDLFDPCFYRSMYIDLADLDDIELNKHWNLLGKNEGRFPNVIKYIDGRSPDINASEYFNNAWFYRGMNKDLLLAGLADVEIVLHYLDLGEKEGREFFIRNWLTIQGIKSEQVLIEIEGALHELCLQDDGVFELRNAAYSIAGLDGVPFEICKDWSTLRVLYERAGIELLRSGFKVEAKNVLNSSIRYGGSSKAYELIGNLFLDEGNYYVAETYFERAINAGSPGPWVYKNLAELYNRTNRYKKAMGCLLIGRRFYPDSELIESELVLSINNYWSETWSKLDGLKVSGDRQRLINEAISRVNLIYDAWYSFYSIETNEHEIALPSINSSRVLIVGDFHIPQCVRYRIDQKVEQLEGQGCYVESLDWTKLAESSNNFALFDIVIFYRVPAVNEVIKKIAFVRALKKIAIYEIDDQIFMPSYPPSQESYGRSVDFTHYSDLIKGMSLNNAAIRLCDFAISSTHPLDEALSSLVRSGESYVHRNGLDSKSWFTSNKGNVTPTSYTDIFYGSGTLAHNEDFIDLAIPALVLLLEEFKFVRLIIAGHLQLPEYFESTYSAKLIRLPKLDVKAYSSYLSKADINLAVLHDNELNSSKSELKWFEAACFGIPSVLSSTANYRDVIEHGKDAFLAETTEEWYQYVKALVEDVGLRKEIGSNAQLKVKQSYSVENLGASLSKFLSSLSRSTS